MEGMFAAHPHAAIRGISHETVERQISYIMDRGKVTDMKGRLPFNWSRMAELQISIDHRLCVTFNSMHCREMGSAHRMKDPAFVGIT